MNTRQLQFIALIVAGVVALNMPARPRARQPGENGPTLSMYLQRLGEKNDCFFTLEESWADSEPMNSLAQSPVSEGISKADLDAQLRALAAVAPNLTFQIDAQNRRIIHIIDRRLTDLRDYSMAEPVHNLDFDGTLRQLVETISRQGIHIAQRTTFGVGDPMDSKSDWTTVVHVKADKATVRSVVSNFIPLKGYSRVMWTASTERRAGATTEINFEGLELQTRGHQ